jgi:hypothetical protein
MSKTEANSPVDLSTMLGTGDGFKAKGKSYNVQPIMIAHIDMFMKDNLSLGVQLFNVTNKEASKKIDKWLSEVEVEIAGKKIKGRYCLDENDEPMSLQKAMADGWDVVDLKNFMKKLCDLSG